MVQESVIGIGGREPRELGNHSDVGASRRAQIIAYVGFWPRIPSVPGGVQIEHFTLYWCSSQVRSLQDLITGRRPTWLLVGPGLGDDRVQSLIYAAKTADPGLLIAMLGPPDDLQRCERWVRRSGVVYLATTVNPERLVELLDISRQYNVLAIDRFFYDLARLRKNEPVASLTRREGEVLQLMCQGHRNVDIARTLSLTESTVEFHVHNLLIKLGARNRVGAVERAIFLGLASAIL